MANIFQSRKRILSSIRIIVFLLLILFGSTWFLFHHQSMSAKLEKSNVEADNQVCQNAINLAVTACGIPVMDQAITLIKSAILFSQHTRLCLFAFTDQHLIPRFAKKLNELTVSSRGFHSGFHYEVLPTTFPAIPKGQTPWGEMFKPCSLQRIFMPRLLSNVDSIIYMDADSLIMSNLSHFWKQFDSMDRRQFIRASFDGNVKCNWKTWYQKHPEIPHYGEQGLNTGIALMNLTRMRNEGFEQLIFKIQAKFEHLRPNNTGDQFLQNILYGFHPEFVKVLPCDWNLHRRNCQREINPDCSCTTAVENGAAVIHGTNNAFTDSERLPLFRHIYESFRHFHMGKDTLGSLYKHLEVNVGLESWSCGFANSEDFYIRFAAYVSKLK